MKRPIVLIALFLGFGIATNFYIQNLHSIALIAIGLFLVLIYLSLQYKDKMIIGVYLFFVLGYFLINSNPSIDLAKKHDITGIVYDVKDVGKYRHIYVKTKYIDNEKVDVNILLKTKDQSVDISDNISFNCELDDFSSSKNDFINNRSKNIVYNAYCFDIEIHGQVKSLYYYKNILHNKINGIYDEILPAEQSSIVKAITLGNRDDLLSETKDLYKIGGIFHILVLSGLHIAIISTFMLSILGLYIKGNKKNIIVIVFLIVFLLFADSSVSTLRAVIMATCLLIAPCFNRQYDNISSIFFALFIILILTPYALFSVSLLLTFTSVLSIILLSDKISYFFKYIAIKSNNSLLLLIKDKIDLISPIISISLVLPIISSYYFYYLYPYSIIANILIISLISPLVILSFLCGLIGVVNIYIAKFLGASIYYILVLFDIVCNFLAKLPYSTILVGKTDIMLIILYFALIYIIFYMQKHKIKLCASILGIIVLISINNNNILKIDILKSDNQTVFVFEDSATILDSNVSNFYDNKNILLSHGFDNASTIITDSIDNTMFLHEQQMLSNVYIRSDNEYLLTLEQNEIENIIIIDGETPFDVDNKTYYIDEQNLYIDTGYITFANIKDINRVSNANVQNIYDYGIIVNNDDSKSIDISREYIKLRVNKNRIKIN